jgi:hypothetical protein
VGAILLSIIPFVVKPPCSEGFQCASEVLLCDTIFVGLNGFYVFLFSGFNIIIS